MKLHSYAIREALEGARWDEAVGIVDDYFCADGELTNIKNYSFEYSSGAYNLNKLTIVYDLVVSVWSSRGHFYRWGSHLGWESCAIPSCLGTVLFTLTPDLLRAQGLVNKG